MGNYIGMIEDIDVEQRLQRELKRDYHIITAEKRLDQIARDFVDHYSKGWETGKAMLVCIDKITCIRRYNLILKYWKCKICDLVASIPQALDQQDEVYRTRQVAWMKETRIAVVISEEQGEVESFRKWDIDIKPHRNLIKQGFETPDGERIDIESAFKKKTIHFELLSSAQFGLPALMCRVYRPCTETNRRKPIP